jgi:hypothetical protein
MATGAVDYTGITEALVTRIMGLDWSSVYALVPDGQPINKVSVFEDATGPEMALNNMPLVNVRLGGSQIKEISLPGSTYEYIHYEVDVYSFSFTSFRDATRLRDGIIKIVRSSLQNARSFHNDLETSKLPTIKFGAFQPEGTGGHVALATLTLVAEAFVDAA